MSFLRMLLRMRKELDVDGLPPPTAVRDNGTGANVGRSGSCSSDVRL